MKHLSLKKTFLYLISVSAIVQSCRRQESLLISPIPNDSIYMQRDANNNPHYYCYFSYLNLSNNICIPAIESLSPNLNLIQGLYPVYAQVPPTLTYPYYDVAQFEIVNWDGTKQCTDADGKVTPCVIGSVNFSATWSDGRTDIVKADVRWTPPIIAQDFFVKGPLFTHGSVAPSKDPGAYEAYIGAYLIPSVNEASAMRTTYRIGKIHTIYNPNYFDVKILVNTVNSSTTNPNCLGQDKSATTYGNPKGTWITIAQNTSIDYGYYMNTNFGSNVACLKDNDAFIYVYSPTGGSTTDEVISSQEVISWISLRFTSY